MQKGRKLIKKGFEPNREQEKIIENREGCRVVVAGAGSGKTKTLVEQLVCRLIEDKKSPESVVSITFTEKAANELKKRVRERLIEKGEIEIANNIEAAGISTIHGFCARLVKENSIRLGIDPGFTVADETRSNILKKEAMDLAVEEFLTGASIEKLDLAVLYKLTGDSGLSGTLMDMYEGIRSRGELTPSMPQLERVTVNTSVLPDLLSLLQQAVDKRYLQDNDDVLKELSRLESAAELLEAPSFDIHSLSVSDFIALLKSSGNSGKGGLRDIKRDINKIAEQIAVDLASYKAYDQYLFARELFGLFVKKYEMVKTRHGVLDFGDLQLYALKLLKEHKHARDSLRQRIGIFQIDEFQDTDYLQYELLGLIAPENLCIVGDRSQSIYGFRNADPALFGKACEKYENTHKLHINYRSNKKIIDFLNHIFASAGFLGDDFLILKEDEETPEKSDRTQGLIEVLALSKSSGDGEKLSEPDARKLEARIIAGKISELKSQGSSYGESAILLRAFTHISDYEAALREQGIPYYLHSGRHYYARNEIKDINNYLKIIANPLDDLSLASVLKSPFARISDGTLYAIACEREGGSGDGRKSFYEAILEIIEGLNSQTRSVNKSQTGFVKPPEFKKLAGFVLCLNDFHASASSSIGDLIENVITRTGYDLAVLSDRYKSRSVFANIRKLIREASAYEQLYGSDLRGFTDYIDEAEYLAAKEGSAQTEGEETDAVKIMTIHAAKGLEFENVFVAGLGSGFSSRGSKQGDFNYTASDQDGYISIGMKYRESLGKSYEALDYQFNNEKIKDAEIQEAKRLIYVACSRAMKRLYLAGTADLLKSKKNPSTILENILSVVEFDEIMLEADGTSEGIAGNSLVDLHYYGGQDFSDSIAVDSQNVILNRSSTQDVECWRSEESPDSIDFSKLELIADSYLGEIFRISKLTASSIKDFKDCPGKFKLKHIFKIAGLPGKKRSVKTSSSKSTAKNMVSAADYGSVVHEVLFGVDWGAFQMPDQTEIERIAAGYLSDKDELNEVTMKAGAQIKKFAGSKVAGDIQTGSKIEKEAPFSFLFDGILYEGNIDVLVDRQTIIDFKTGSHSDALAAGYEIQMDLYATALLRSGAEEKVVAKLIFLDNPDEPVTKEYDRNDLEALEKKFSEIAGEISSADLSPGAEVDYMICQDCPGFGTTC